MLIQKKIANHARGQEAMIKSGARPLCWQGGVSGESRFSFMCVCVCILTKNLFNFSV